MAKKIRFPLSLPDGTQARSLDELQEHFDLEAVLGHYKSGKLLTWLRDRYNEEEADALEVLDETAPDFQWRLCEVLGVEFTGSGADLEEIARRQERLAKLRQFTDEDEFIRGIDQVAFDQEELADLLDEGCEKIYLCGERFTVPASQRNKTYVGVNSPVVRISGTVGSDWAERDIAFIGCRVENLPCMATEMVENGPTAPVIDDGPITITEEMAGDIFDAIFQNAADLDGREIVAETNHYYVIEDQPKGYDISTASEFPMKYWRVDKKTCSFEELPNLYTFSISSKSYKLHYEPMNVFALAWEMVEEKQGKKKPIKMFRAPSYKYGDSLYMLELSNGEAPSVWHLDLSSKSLTKVIDGVGFICQKLPASTLLFDGRYIPVLQNNKFCALDVQSAELIKVRYKGQWMDAPYGAAVTEGKMYFIANETQIGRTNNDKIALCYFDIKEKTFSEIQNISFDNCEDNTGTLGWLNIEQIDPFIQIFNRTKCRNFTEVRSENPVTGVMAQNNQIVLFLGEYDHLVLDISTQIPQAKLLFSTCSGGSGVSIRLWDDGIICLHRNDEDSTLYIVDLLTSKEHEAVKINARCDEVFTRIGEYVYLSPPFLSTDGYRVALEEPHECCKISMKNIPTRTKDDRFKWKESDE